MKRTVLLILITCVILSNVYSQNRRVGDYELNGTVLIKYHGNAREVRIPSNLGITEIGGFGFMHNRHITSVIIPEGVITIGNNAFAFCINLTSIIIPEGLTTILQAFNGSGITNINIPASVTNIAVNNESANPGGAFTLCERLININVSSQNLVYSSINGILFNKEGTILLQYPRGRQEQNYTIPNGVTAIGNCAFFEANNLVNINIPTSIINVGAGAFYNCDNLNSITRNEIIRRFGESVFNFLFAG